MSYSVLVVDDESEIRLLYRTELEENGYKVFEASGSEDCFRILEKEKIDVVLLDIKLKGESGIDILQEITKKYKEIKTILATAYSAYQDDFSTWLADGYWVKSPSDLESLLEEVAAVIKKNKA
jgi:DNA-binding NtrC family response regulator